MIEAQSLLADKSWLASLQIPDPSLGRMGDRVRAAALFRERVGSEFVIEGWVEGPCAETADLRGLSALMLDFFDEPAFVHAAFEFTTGVALRFAAAQVEAGVDVVGVGDAAASLVGPQIYREFVAPYEQRLVDGIHAMGAKVRLHICGNTTRIAGDMAELGADIVDIDSPVPLGAARAAAGPTQVLAGNLDPVAVVMRGTPAGIGDALAGCQRDAGPRWIVGAGCELPRDTPRENVEALAAYAQTHRP
jgi:MtaA/CmuA family methyltransferase